MAKNNFDFLGELEDELDSTWNYGLGTAINEGGEAKDRARDDREIRRLMQNPERVAEIKKIADEYTWFKLGLVAEEYEREEDMPVREHSLKCERFLSGLLKGEIEYHVADKRTDKTGGDQVEVPQPVVGELQSDDEQQSE